jgi:membrane protease YdiL (CAAX protease family)
LAAVVMLELVIGPRVSTLRALGLPEVSPYIRVPLLLASALALARWFARVPWRELGLRPWHDWAESEKWYFVEVVLLANIVFALLYGQRLQAPPWMALSFLWGFHQEVVYRGMLQGELTRRLGSAAGVALSNLLFTFGPLHWYHFARGPAAAPMFLAIFLVGLYLGILQLRSRNLWMVGTFHGIGTAWILSATAPAG